jgi:glycerol-3-phosphate O-acyltransferase
MYINIGEPFSVKEYLQKIPYSDESLKPIDLQNISPAQFRQVQDVAELTVTLQQRNTVATISNLLAVVLMQSLMRQKCLTYDEVLSEVEWVEKVCCEYIDQIYK